MLWGISCWGEGYKEIDKCYFKLEDVHNFYSDVKYKLSEI